MIPTVTGPTGVGKTRVALELAKLTGGEIINADSQSVYKYFNIATSKPPRAMRSAVRHHLVGFRDPGQQFTVGDFVSLASSAARKIEKKGKVPVISGGTGLYVSKLAEGVSMLPSSDKVRQSVERTDIKKLLSELKRKDPQTYRRIDRRNPRRVARAVEICRITGMPASEALKKYHTPGLELKIFLLERPRDELYGLIDVRVDSMIARGLAREVRALLKRGVPPEAPPFGAIGYAEMLEYVAGKISLAEASEKIKFRTHALARRQDTWWRSRKALRIEVSGRRPRDIASEIAKQIK